MDNKEKSKIIKIADMIYKSNQVIAYEKIVREDQREILRNYGIIDFNEMTRVEIYFLYLYASLRAINDYFFIVKDERKAIIITEELFKIEKDNLSHLTEWEYWQYYLLQKKRLESYEKIFKLIHYENENPIKSTCEMLFNIWKPLMKPDAKKENIYDSIKLVSLFTNIVTNWATLIADIINEKID